ncbi:MAG: glycosyltransferase family 39 protein, partial [Candidatus Riflemargulisbacteria bacterium]
MIDKYNKILIISMFLFAIISLLTIAINPLIIDDASMYALAIKNAVIYNAWFAPVFTPGDISSFLDKPPLGIWILSVIPKIFGVSVVTVHITNVLLFFLLVGLLYRFLLKEAARDTAVFSAMVALTSLILVIFSRTPKLDMLIALTLMLSHFELFKFIKYKKIKYAYFFTFFCAVGFLIKSGFALVFPVMTVVSLLSYKEIRVLLFRTLISKHGLLNILFFIIIISSVLLMQKPTFGELWIDYLRSFTITSKYNTSYLGFTFNLSVIIFLLLSVFPWTSCVIIDLKEIKKEFSLYAFTFLWLISNTVFVILFYKQTDVRTYVMLSVPLITLISFGLSSLLNSAKKNVKLSIVNVLLGSIFTIVSVILIINNDSLFYISIPFSLALFLFSLFFVKPTRRLLIVVFSIICLSYTLFFWQAKSIVDRNNPFQKYPQIISMYKAKGCKFVIFRPADRPTVMSNDHTYIDFINGPADYYVWEYAKMEELITSNIILVLDPQSL